ncbi:MAG: hypothetical protein M3384_11690 [Acidobacteriota bacterium]|nr:hypothetical protein [Acidobacteriota bacterium]
MQSFQGKSVATYSSSLIKNSLRQEPNPAIEENMLEALKVLSYSILSEVESLSKEKSKHTYAKIDLAEEVQKYEASLIRCALMRTGGNQRRAARLLNLKITTLNSKIRRYGITPSGLSVAAERK